MLNIEDKMNNLYKYFEGLPHILAVWIIGSYGTEFQREESDIDFAILYDRDVSPLYEAKNAVDITDILRTENVDIINIKNAPITLQFKCIKEGRSVYERDFIKVSDYIELVINMYQDKKYYIDSFDRDYFNSFNI